jgi:hypothetical protein
MIIRDDAPIFVTRDRRLVYLVPLSMMRRRTLVNFKMEDENGTCLPMLGMRVTQQLDASMLFAAAATISPSLTKDDQLIELIENVTAGTADVVEKAHRSFCDSPPASLRPLAGRTIFSEALNRLRWNFSLYACLEVKAGRHRILKLSFDEPFDWRLQQPAIISEGKGERSYKPSKRVPQPKRFFCYMFAKFGILPTRFRFQIPAAENAASYHFEATAPLGVRIVRASLLAGRPHEPDGHVSVDRIVGHAATVGLHAVEIPNNSLCRVQLDLRVPSRGWLTQLVTSCAVILGILISLGLLWQDKLSSLTQDQLTNVVVILVAASAATATLVAERRFHGLPASMVTHLRAIGVMSLCLPIVAAGYLVYASRPPRLRIDHDQFQLVMLLLVGFAALFFLIPVLALFLSSLNERLQRAEASPWDMTILKESDTISVHQRSKVSANYLEALRQLKFGSAAIGIQSAEGWHELYRWTDKDQDAAVHDLTELRKILDRGAEYGYCQSVRCIDCNAMKRCLLLRSGGTVKVSGRFY